MRYKDQLADAIYSAFHTRHKQRVGSITYTELSKAKAGDGCTIHCALKNQHV
jgi:hypothetical protein